MPISAKLGEPIGKPKLVAVAAADESSDGPIERNVKCANVLEEVPSERPVKNDVLSHSMLTTPQALPNVKKPGSVQVFVLSISFPAPLPVRSPTAIGPKPSAKEQHGLNRNTKYSRKAWGFVTDPPLLTNAEPKSKPVAQTTCPQSLFPTQCKTLLALVATSNCGEPPAAFPG